MLTKSKELAKPHIPAGLLSDQFLDFFKKNTAPFEELMAFYECAIMEVETKFKVLNRQFSLQYDRNPIESIQTRLKSTDSLVRKLNKQKTPFTMEAIEREIHDIAGVRVICSFVDDIYMLADCLTSQDDVTLVEAKDYIKNPKPSGYRSLHLIIKVPIFLQNEKRDMKVEVQLRTIVMDCWASLEHKLQYKKNIAEEKADMIQTELTEVADICAAIDSRMQDIRDAIVTTETENLEETRRLHSSYILGRIRQGAATVAERLPERPGKTETEQ